MILAAGIETIVEVLIALALIGHRLFTWIQGKVQTDAPADVGNDEAVPMEDPAALFERELEAARALPERLQASLRVWRAGPGWSPLLETVVRALDPHVSTLAQAAPEDPYELARRRAALDSLFASLDRAAAGLDEPIGLVFAANLPGLRDAIEGQADIAIQAAGESEVPAKLLRDWALWFFADRLVAVTEPERARGRLAELALRPSDFLYPSPPAALRAAALARELRLPVTPPPETIPLLLPGGRSVPLPGRAAQEQGLAVADAVGGASYPALGDQTLRQLAGLRPAFSAPPRTKVTEIERAIGERPVLEVTAEPRRFVHGVEAGVAEPTGIEWGSTNDAMQLIRVPRRAAARNSLSTLAPPSPLARRGSPSTSRRQRLRAAIILSETIRL